ncbi:MAG: hypothetical protein QM647_15050 [Asticcacaulis sp.]|uniref:DUF6950 family protein n=1 Tax=Asticcacaulis sp. TaxID=1872648 RepID=UPI0039E42FD1
MDLIYRTACAEQTVAQYIDARFEWGRYDCARMTAAHVKRMGHKASLAMFGHYKSLAGAKRALTRAGFDSLEAVLDARFARIAPASAWVGDIIALPGDTDMPALAVRLTNGRVICLAGEGFVIAEPVEYVAAWRIPYIAVSAT